MPVDLTYRRACAAQPVSSASSRARVCSRVSPGSQRPPEQDMLTAVLARHQHDVALVEQDGPDGTDQFQRRNSCGQVGGDLQVQAARPAALLRSGRSQSAQQGCNSWMCVGHRVVTAPRFAMGQADTWPSDQLQQRPLAYSVPCPSCPRAAPCHPWKSCAPPRHSPSPRRSRQA